MSLFKRRMSRRALGVVVGASLLVFGLQAPAFAQLGLTSFTPTSGPTNCVVVITGTDFQGPDVTSVKFGAATATISIRSDTELWAAVPAGLTAGTGVFITLTKATGETVSSSTQFTPTTGAGTCAPTITSFTPTCGTVGTVVTITGTNLIGATTPTGGVTTLSGGTVEFSPFAVLVGQSATHTGTSENPTTLQVLVPTGAKTGPISVQTAGGEVFSTADFKVVTDLADCAAPGAVTHARSISLSLRKHLVARGTVTSTEDPAVTECVAGVPVKIQRRKAGAWKNVGTTTTSDTGKYKRQIKDKPGKYRAVAPAVTLEDDSVCLKAVSPRVIHRH